MTFRDMMLLASEDFDLIGVVGVGVQFDFAVEDEVWVGHDESPGCIYAVGRKKWHIHRTRGAQRCCAHPGR